MKTESKISANRMPMRTIGQATNDSGAGSLHQAMSHAGVALSKLRMFSGVSYPAFLGTLLLVFLLVSSAQAQTPCPGSDTCPGPAAQMVCPDPGTTLPGNDVTFTWCNANADYFLQIESIPGAHNIFFAFVPAQNFVHLINLPTNGATIYVTLWTQVKGTWQTPFNYTYTAANFIAPRLGTSLLGTNGQFQFTISGVTAGKTNVVQCSVNMVDWNSIATNVAASNNLQILDCTATNFSQRFYRSFEIH